MCLCFSGINNTFYMRTLLQYVIVLTNGEYCTVYSTCLLHVCEIWLPTQETHSQQQGASSSFSAIATTLTSPTCQTSQPSFLFKEPIKDVPDDPTQVSVIERLFGSEMETRIECGCGWRSAIKRTELLHSLLYPHKAKSGESLYLSRLVRIFFFFCRYIVHYTTLRTVSTCTDFII